MQAPESRPSDLAAQPAQQAIPALFELHGAQIRSLGLRACGSPQEADDLVQETFLIAYRKWHQFEGRSSPRTWLYTIAGRVCCRLHRKRAGEPRHMESLSELLPTGLRRIPDPATSGGGPDDLLLKNELKSTVEAAISKLPINFQLPLVLKDIAEFSIHEVAEILGLKEATVKTRVHRARLFLRRELSAKLPQRTAQPPDHSRQVCLDLLKAKLEAMDRGVDFPYADSELCERCRSLFKTLDLTFDVCLQIGAGTLPLKLKREMEEVFGNLPRVP